MFWKNSNSSGYRCCFCFHVRTGTLLIGLLSLLMHAITLSVLFVALLHPDLVHQMDSPSSSDTHTPSFWRSLSDVTFRCVSAMDKESLLLGIGLTLALMAISGCLLYGTIKGSPKHLIPFLSIQVLHACIGGLTMIDHLSSVSRFRKWIAAQQEKHMANMDALLRMDDDHLMLWGMIMFASSMFIMIYLISVVWRCYNFLQEQISRQTQLSRRYEDADFNNPNDAELLLPPKYEDIILVPVVPMTEATATSPPAYVENEN